jgi:hypothetical protein
MSFPSSVDDLEVYVPPPPVALCKGGSTCLVRTRRANADIAGSPAALNLLV